MKNYKFFTFENRVSMLVSCVAFTAFANIPTAFSAAKPPTTPPSCNNNSNGSTPNPVRRVIVQPIGTKIFQLPNGNSANFAADLQTILSTAIANTASFEPADPAQYDPCNSHIEIRAAVTSFQLDVGGFGVSFGFSPSGSIQQNTNITGSVDVKIGVISMDFSVWHCSAGNCSSLAASTANQNTSGVTAGFQINFGQIKTGTDLVYNTPLAGILRAIMIDGMTQLAAAPRLSDLPWQATVRQYDSSTGTFIFDAGTQSRIGVNQTFEVFAPTDSSATGTCNVFQAVANGHTIQVNTVSSTAMIDATFGSRGIRVGDIVMVRTTK